MARKNTFFFLNKKYYTHKFKEGELDGHYKDWKIISSGIHQTPWERHGKDGKRHRHMIATIIAQKP